MLAPLPDRRRSPRLRTRLRAGRLLDEMGGFVADVTIHDLSAGGARLRLPPGTDARRAARLYDEATATVRGLTRVWRTGMDLGCACADARPPDPREAAAARPYYAAR